MTNKKPSKVHTIHKTHIVTGTSIGLSLNEWQANDELVKNHRELQKDPRFLAAMDVMRTEAPANWMLKPGFSPHDHSKHLGYIEGYQAALNNMEALAKRATPKEQIEATFEPPEPETKPE